VPATAAAHWEIKKEKLKKSPAQNTKQAGDQDTYSSLGEETPSSILQCTGEWLRTV